MKEIPEGHIGIVHLYGKKEIREVRKMGHINIMKVEDYEAIKKAREEKDGADI